MLRFHFIIRIYIIWYFGVNLAVDNNGLSGMILKISHICQMS